MLQRNEQPRVTGSVTLRRHVLAGSALLIVLVGGLGWWSATTVVAGAIIASGTVVIEGGAKRIQHPEGGVVAEILVDDGDWVEAGAVVFRLEGTAVAASLNIVLGQLRDAFARLARLQGELADAGAPVVTDLPPTLAGPEFDLLLQAQRHLMMARAGARTGRHAQIVEKINQLRNRIEGHVAQRLSSETQLALLVAEGADLESLQADGLVSTGRVNELMLRRLQIEGSIGQLTASIGEAMATISEHETVLGFENDQLRSEVLSEQQVTRAQVAELLQQQVALDAQLAKLEVRAPIAGTVHATAVHTVGGVVGAGETAMLIVPRLDGASIQVRISPLDIEEVSSAQQVLLKFPGLSARSSPDLSAQIESVSPDLTTDPNGAQYYQARVVVEREELERLPGHVLVVAGMPADAFIRTTDRTVLDFLLDPVTDLVSRAFRED